MSSSVEKLVALGQSIWYDNIQRRMLEDGTIAGMIERGEVRGMTSNPSIFNHAISKSHDYETALKSMAWGGYSGTQILDRLILEDIRAAADLFLPLYRATGGRDGYVSIEVRPDLAADTAGTVTEARRLWELADRPNVMVKIPATAQGIPAIRQSIAQGININITLIFSLASYLEVMDAFLSGLEDRLRSGLPIDTISSVASFFVSRIDTKADPLLEKIVKGEGPQAGLAARLLGKIAIANARLAYARFKEVFASERFAHLKAQGARIQRPLWASTSTKNPQYPDTIYVDELIGPDTVNTMPSQTLEAFIDHGTVKLSVESGLEEARGVFNDLEQLGISIDRITQELEQEGVKAFAGAFESLQETVEQRRGLAVAELGPLAERVARRVAWLDSISAPSHLRAFDPSLWTEDTAERHEIRKRLGWITLPEKSQDLLPDLRYFNDAVRAAGYDRVLLLGMGGSSLAAKVITGLFDSQPAGLELEILDSTDPAQVLDSAHRTQVEKTLFIVSSKSGSTVESDAFLSYFWSRACEAVGNHAGEHFVAITDPESPLEKAAQKQLFRRIFAGDSRVGGRFATLSTFGLVPAALLGLEVDRLLGRASWMTHQTEADVPAGRNPGAVLGSILGEAALQGRDKLTFLLDPELTSLGAWLEQLVAESSGKDGKGILPVISEPPADPELYGQDRLFIRLRQDNGPQTVKLDQAAAKLLESGRPVLTITLGDPYDIGAELYRWEMAIAYACLILGVNPFNQPDVQASKQRILEQIDAYHQTGKLDEGTLLMETEGAMIYGITLPVGLAKSGRSSLGEVLDAFLAQGLPGDYVALNAFLPQDEHLFGLLSRARLAVHRRTRLATTIGFGPGFLHSSGQYYKGGPNTGLFLLITADPVQDVDIPGKGLTFGILERAQALGDMEALLARGRRVLRVHLAHPDDLAGLVKTLESLPDQRGRGGYSA